MRHKGLMGDVSKIFGNNLRFFRERESLTQEQLAEKIGSNCSNTTIYYWENGLRWPSIRNVRQIAKALGIPEEELFSPVHGPTRLLIKQAVDSLCEVFDL